MQNSDSNALVYVVDDEFSVRDSISLLLKSIGRNVKSFACSKDFLQAYEPKKPGCLVLDVRMPEMDGIELQQELSNQKINIPIIFISGNAVMHESVKAFRSGALDFLEKPYDNKILLERIEEGIKKDMDIMLQREELQNIQDCIDKLTAREFAVLDLIIHGHSNKTAAKFLQISPRTIETHRNNIMGKMRSDDFSDLVTKIVKYHELKKL